MRVCEIFRSIQGESSFMGLPCTFVRLAGCNLRCAWCDTAYAQDPSGGREMSVHEILREVRALGTDLVEITGGEPMLQHDTPNLMHVLLDMGAKVLLETNGTIDLADVDSRVVVVMDVKAPSSGHADRNRWENIEALQENDEIKVVLEGRADYEWALRELRARGAIGAKRVTFSPVFGKLDTLTLAEWILKDSVPVKVGLQLHKLLWGPDRRGV